MNVPKTSKSEHQSNSILKENQTERNELMTKRSFELLEKLSSERDEKVRKLNFAHAQSVIDKFPQNALAEISNFKLKRIDSNNTIGKSNYSKIGNSRNEEKSTGLHQSSKTMSGEGSKNEKTSRNNTVRSYKELIPNSLSHKNSEFVLFEIVKD
mmetsp:Transcript_7960/g.7044  ORF Transcript_7960/g.7044 Transcript_7960/m.7044 type:complete len:154 (-) Transcript_7960:32-493(-)